MRSKYPFRSIVIGPFWSTPSFTILSMSSFSELPPPDQDAIGKTLLTLLKAFDERDAEPLKHV